LGGDTLVVGAYHDGVGANPNQGSAYVFQNTFCSRQSGNWGSTTTWVGGVVPGSADDACISTGDTVTLAANAAANRVLVNPNAALDLSTFALTAEDTVMNNGVISQTQTVNNASVEFLYLQNIAASATKYRGVVVNSSTSGANLGAVSVGVRETLTWFGWYNGDNVDDTRFCTDTGSGSPVYAERCYRLTPTTNGAATLRLYARTADELNGIAQGSLAIYRYTGGAWVQLTTNASTGRNGSYSYAQADTPGFSSFLLGQGGSTPTAVELQSFSAANALAALPILAGLLLLAALSGVLV
jgi:hypothetical protein